MNILNDIRGRIKSLTPEQIAEREAQRMRDEEQAENLRQSRAYAAFVRAVGPAYKDCRFENFVCKSSAAEAVLLKCKEIAAGDIDNLPSMVWMGSVGSGKDHLMTCLIRAAMKGGKSVRRDDGADFAGMLRDQIKSDESESEFLQRFTSPDIWAISDPDGMRDAVSEHHAEWLGRIIDKRVRIAKPTWVTFNGEGSQGMASRLGVRVTDRLINSAVVMLCNWPSHRKPIEVIGGAK
jgi:DNA replication protein DnaC